MPDLDPSSIIIGELKGQFGALEKYIHSQFHDMRNHNQLQINGLEKILKELKDLQERDQQSNKGAHDELEERIEALEARAGEEKAVKGALGWFLQSPILGWLVAAVAILWDNIMGKGHP